MITRCVALILPGLLGFLTLLGIPATPLPSSDRDMGVARATGVESHIDSLFKGYARDTPGAVVAVMRAGEIVFSKAYGMADLERRVPMSTESVFNLASMSKQFTAMCVAILVGEGKLVLSDEIHRFIPELPDYGHPITLANLLHHTSGLKDYGQVMQRCDFSEFDAMTRERVLPLICRQRSLNFLPGSEFEYSDTNYALLALVVERVSGHSFAAFARYRVFEPLGMTHTHVCDDVNALIPDRALGYARADNTWWIADSYSQVGGDGDVFSTVGDLAKWDRNFYDFKVGGEPARKILLDTQPLTDGFPSNYAGGLKILDVLGLRAIEHSGGAPGYDVDMIRFPTERLSVAVLTNDRDDSKPKTFVQQVAALYLRGTPKPQPYKPPQAVTLDPKELAAMTGVYWDSTTDAVRRIAVYAGGLANAKLPSKAFAPMTALDESRFTVGVVEYAFTNGTMSRATPGLRPVVYHRVDPTPSDASTLSGFSGTYYCEDADVTYRIRCAGAKLVLARKGRADEELVPAFRDAFFGDPGLLVFHRLSGRIVLDVLGERLRKLTFEPS